jgi:probable phosphoglycerate mutase
VPSPASTLPGTAGGEPGIGKSITLIYIHGHAAAVDIDIGGGPVIQSDPFSSQSMNPVQSPAARATRNDETGMATGTTTDRTDTASAGVTDIYLLRHGETDWNAIRRVQGQIDIGLNARGRQQASLLAQALAQTPLAAVHSSDLQRAHDTALAVAGPHGLPVTTTPALRERSFGGFEGKLYGELREHFPDAYDAYITRDIDARYPDGERATESLRQFSERSVAAVERLASAHRGQTIAIVAHGGVLDCLYRAATGMDLAVARNFDIFNASINRFRFDGSRFSIVLWSDSGHLNQKSLDEILK